MVVLVTAASQRD